MSRSESRLHGRQENGNRNRQPKRSAEYADDSQCDVQLNDVLGWSGRFAGSASHTAVGECRRDGKFLARSGGEKKRVIAAILRSVSAGLWQSGLNRFAGQGNRRVRKNPCVRQRASRSLSGGRHKGDERVSTARLQS